MNRLPSRLILLDRDGVVVVNRSDNVKRPEQLELIEGAAAAIACLNRAGYAVAICTNQPEVRRGAMTARQLADVHRGLRRKLAPCDAAIDRIFTCTATVKCPLRKPAGGMLRKALRHYRAEPAQTAFVGDQLDDLRAAFHAGCRRVLVRTGLGEKTLRRGLPAYLLPVSVHDDLAAAVEAELQPASRRRVPLTS